jgi:hypothetical protein
MMIDVLLNAMVPIFAIMVCSAISRAGSATSTIITSRI